jgi:hypothetical protein
MALDPAPAFAGFGEAGDADQRHFRWVHGAGTPLARWCGLCTERGRMRPCVVPHTSCELRKITATRPAGFARGEGGRMQAPSAYSAGFPLCRCSKHMRMYDKPLAARHTSSVHQRSAMAPATAANSRRRVASGSMHSQLRMHLQRSTIGRSGEGAPPIRSNAAGWPSGWPA